MELTWYIAAGVIVAIAGLAGTLLTLATMPGTWLTLLVALLIQWWRSDTFNWWTLGAAFALAILAEVAEFIAGGAGASKAGGSGRAAVWSIAGGILGAILGTVLLPVPVIGTIVGGVGGAAAAAIAAERTLGKTWRDSARVGQGAAIGRAASIVIKGAFAAAIGLLLTIAAFVK